MAKKQVKKTAGKKASKKTVGKGRHESVQTSKAIKKDSNNIMLGILALAFSLLGFVLSWIISFGWALSLLGVIFGYSGLKHRNSRGISILAVIIGALGLIIWLLLFLFRPFSAY
ncbi:MAG: hypothetical protein AABW41_02465 [Nanoarchaeota archaeon]